MVGACILHWLYSNNNRSYVVQDIEKWQPAVFESPSPRAVPGLPGHHPDRLQGARRDDALHDADVWQPALEDTVRHIMTERVWMGDRKSHGEGKAASSRRYKVR